MDKDDIKTDDQLDENENVVDEGDVNEATAAASSLKPNSNPANGWSKSEILSRFMGKLAGMKKDDLSDLFHKTIAQIGHEEDPAPNAAAKNKASVAGKGAGVAKPTNQKSPMPDPSTMREAVKEDMDELFSEDDLSEEFRTKATTVFEAAVTNRVAIETARIEEEFENKLEEELSKEVDQLHEKVDSYLEYVVEKWMEENQAIVESNFRSQIAENFLSGLKDLFTESYVEVPEDKIDLVSELTDRVEELENEINETTKQNLELTKIVEEAEKEVVFDEVSEDLADTQVDKFRTLTESVEAEDLEEYKKKITIIKEQYFNKSSDSESNDSKTGIITENVGNNDDAGEEKKVSPEMSHYVAAIKRTSKKY